jgi:hypothetical protein
MSKGFPAAARPILVLACASILASCASEQQAAPGPSVPTATPFQPGVYDSPFSVPFLPQIVPTFTAYPTIMVEGGAFPTPIQVAPAAGSLLSVLAVDPLTGLAADDPALLDRRPIAVKIANYPRYIRPQSGLTLADVVFEYYIEDLVTRFIAVFYGQDATWAGPVRSGRFFDEHVTRMYHAFYVFKYADPREYSYFKGSDLYDRLVVPGFGKCPPFFQGRRKTDTGRLIESYNNVFFNTAAWAACAAGRGADNSRQPLRNGFFSSTAPPSTLTADRIFTHYSADDYNYWQYDPDRARYLRYQETNDTRSGRSESYAPLTDALTEQPVTADNVVVLFVRHVFANENQAEDEVYHIDLIDSGEAYLFRDGHGFPAVWYRSDPDQPLVIASPAGAPLFLKPGRTFYQVIGQASNDWSDGADWHFDFATP